MARRAIWVTSFSYRIEKVGGITFLKGAFIKKKLAGALFQGYSETAESKFTIVHSIRLYYNKLCFSLAFFYARIHIIHVHVHTRTRTLMQQ